MVSCWRALYAQLMPIAAAPRTTSATKNQPQFRFLPGAVIVVSATKSQAPNPKNRELGFGAWDLGFPRSPPRLGEHLRLRPLGDHHDPRLGQREPPLAVVLGVVPDGGVRRHLHVLVDDRPPDPGVSADVDPVVQDRLLDHRVAVDSDVRR